MTGQPDKEKFETLPRPEPEPAKEKSAETKKAKMSEEDLERILSDAEQCVKEDIKKHSGKLWKTEGWLDRVYKDSFRTVVITGVTDSGKTYFIAGFVDYLRKKYGEKFKVIFREDYLDAKIAAWNGSTSKLIYKTPEDYVYPMVLKLEKEGEPAKYVCLFDVSGEDYAKQYPQSFEGMTEMSLEAVYRKKPADIVMLSLKKANGHAISLIDLIGKPPKAITNTKKLGVRYSSEFTEKCPGGQHNIRLNDKADNSEYYCKQCDIRYPAVKVMKLHKQDKSPRYCPTHRNNALAFVKDKHAFVCRPQNGNCNYSEPAELDWTEDAQHKYGTQTVYIQRLMREDGGLIKKDKWLPVVTKADMLKENDEDHSIEECIRIEPPLAEKMLFAEGVKLEFVSTNYLDMDPKKENRTYGMEAVEDFVFGKLFQDDR